MKNSRKRFSSVNWTKVLVPSHRSTFGCGYRVKKPSVSDFHLTGSISSIKQGKIEVPGESKTTNHDTSGQCFPTQVTEN